MSLRRAKSVDEYVAWVQQAVSEVGDPRECLLFEVEDRNRCPAFIDPLEEGVKALYQSMNDGTYRFGREYLPFMDLAGRFADEIPFHTLLKQINETHCRGLGVDGGSG